MAWRSPLKILQTIEEEQENIISNKLHVRGNNGRSIINDIVMEDVKEEEDNDTLSQLPTFPQRKDSLLLRPHQKNTHKPYFIESRSSLAENIDADDDCSLLKLKEKRMRHHGNHFTIQRPFAHREPPSIEFSSHNSVKKRVTIFGTKVRDSVSKKSFSRFPFSSEATRSIRVSSTKLFFSYTTNRNIQFFLIRIYFITINIF
jgi:hypothetical protein